jgi:hypothetical protein
MDHRIVPPPPPPPPDASLEVTVRTLASDIESLKKSGGNAIGLPGASMTITGGDSAVLREKISRTLIWTLVFAVGTIVLFFVGYYLIPIITDRKVRSSEFSIAGQNMKETANNTISTQGTSTEATYFGHTSYFTKSPSATEDFDPLHDVQGVINKASVVALIETLTKTKVSGALFELVTKGAEERPLPWSGITELFGAQGLDRDVFREAFSRDFTFFVWRDAGGAWPGFIFKLKEDKSPLLVQKQMLAIESPASNFAELFLREPEDAPASFVDTQVSGQPARALVFPKSSTTFAYGWFFGKYLIMSTSLEGLKQALLKM